MAIAATLLAVVLALRGPYQPRSLRMPDPWAYAFAIENFARVQWTVTEKEVAAESTQVRLQGGRLTQYGLVAAGRWALTKSPGYPLLAIPFQWIGQVRWANAALALLAALCLYALLAAWQNEWTALLGVVIGLLSPLSLVAMHQAYMDTYAAGAVPLIGGALVLRYAVRKPEGGAWLGLFLGGIALGWATAVRVPNILLLLPAGGYLLAHAWRRQRAGAHKPWWDLLAFGLGCGLALVALAAYNQAVFGRPIDIGYQYGPYRGEFSWWAGGASPFPSSGTADGLPPRTAAVVLDNLRRWALPLWIGWPCLPLALGGGLVAWRKPGQRLFAGYATLWILLTYLPYTGIFHTGITRELGNPFNLGWGFYIVDRLVFPALLPITLLSAFFVVRLPRWLIIVIALVYAILGGWLSIQALAAMA